MKPLLTAGGRASDARGVSLVPLSAMATAFSDTLQTIQNADVNGELQKALQDSPECDSITNS
jgi:hypothetical protein